MLVSRLHPGVLGGTAPSTNSGKFEANGYDVSLTWHDKIGSFNYHVGGTLTYMTNKLVDGGNIVVSAGYNEAVNGYPLNSYLATAMWARYKTKTNWTITWTNMWAATLSPCLPTCVWATTCMKM